LEENVTTDAARTSAVTADSNITDENE
jgi:hypothetical protein